MSIAICRAGSDGWTACPLKTIINPKKALRIQSFGPSAASKVLNTGRSIYGKKCPNYSGVVLTKGSVNMKKFLCYIEISQVCD